MVSIDPGNIEDSLEELLKKLKTDAEPEEVRNEWKEILEKFLNKGRNPDKKVFSKLEDGYVARTNSLNADIPYTGVIQREAPKSGTYGGMSVVMFPSTGDEKDKEIMLCFGIGTNGLSPDEAILSSFGHRRRLMGLKKFINKKFDLDIWVKSQIENLSEPVPKMVQEKKDFSGKFNDAFDRYGDGYLYSTTLIPESMKKATRLLYWHILVYALERDWVLKGEHAKNLDRLESQIQDKWRVNPTKDEIKELLRQRHFVILQGPPGTGKTMLAKEIAESDSFYHDPRFQFIQFHPNTTYESFVRGIEPDFSKEEELTFKGSNGPLAEICKDAKGDEQDYILLIDEINRADLGKVLGEAIHLFEYSELKEKGEVGPVRTTYSVYESGEEDSSLSLSDNVFVLGTMNTADRSIAILDFAIRRRFAFVTLWPDRSVVEEENSKEVNELALEYFDKVSKVFFENASEEELHLQPGHSYFLADDEKELENKMRYEVAPLLEEYLVEGSLQSAREEIKALASELKGESF